MRLATVARLTALLILAGAVASCGLFKKTKTTVASMFGRDLQVEIFVDPQLNLTSPLAVELVLLEDKKLALLVAELTAREWFAGRSQFARDHKKGWSSQLWECVPGQKIDPQPQTVRVKSGTKSAYLFADYLVPGAHREQVDPHKHFVLRLGETAFTVEPLG